MSNRKRSTIRTSLSYGWAVLPVGAVVATAMYLNSPAAEAFAAPLSAPQKFTAEAVTTPVGAQRLARGVAGALASQEARVALREAMRLSEVNEHKLVYQDYITTEWGASLHSAAAMALGLSTGDLDVIVAELPRLDFYFPLESDRKTWGATDDVRVASTFDKWADFVQVYSTAGDVGPLMAAKMSDPGFPFLILHPEEVKLKRDFIEMTAPGTPIQGADDFGAASSAPKQVGGIRFAKHSTENSLLVDPGIYINHFNIQKGDGWFGDLEMRFESWAVNGVAIGGAIQWNRQCSLGAYARNGVKQSQGYDGLVMLSPGITGFGSLPCTQTPGYSNFYAIQIIEDDGGGTGTDDNFGWRYYISVPYPGGASLGVVDSYYQNTFPQSSGNRSAYLRIVVQ